MPRKFIPSVHPKAEMNSRDFLNFFKTSSGKIVVFGALFAGALMILSVVRKHHPSAEDGIAVAALSTNATDKPQVVQTIVRPMQVYNPPPSKSQPTALPSSSQSAYPNPSSLPLVPASQSPTLPAISLFADSSAGIPPVKKLGGGYAPFGRLIP